MIKHRFILKLYGLILAIFVPIVDFDLITSNKLKWTIYFLLVIGILTDFILDIPTKVKKAEEMINRVLDIASLGLAKRKSKIRISIFMKVLKLPWKWVDQLEIKFSSNNMIDAPDKIIKLEKWQGLTGFVWGIRKAYMADLSHVSEKELMEKWKLDKHQISITKDVKSIISFPIRHPQDSNCIIGILCIDSTDPIYKKFESKNFQEKGIELSEVVARLLTLYNIVKPI